MYVHAWMWRSEDGSRESILSYVNQTQVVSLGSKHFSCRTVSVPCPPLYYHILKTYLFCVWSHVPQHICGDQRTASWHKLSLCSTQVLELGYRLAGLSCAGPLLPLVLSQWDILGSVLVAGGSCVTMGKSLNLWVENSFQHVLWAKGTGQPVTVQKVLLFSCLTGLNWWCHFLFPVYFLSFLFISCNLEMVINKFKGIFKVYLQY